VDWTQIDIPAPFGHVVRVADIVSELRPLAADFTDLCHNSLVPLGLDAEKLILQEIGRFRQLAHPPGVGQFELWGNQSYL
jgi:hypothetical protein